MTPEERRIADQLVLLSGEQDERTMRRLRAHQAATDPSGGEPGDLDRAATDRLLAKFTSAEAQAANDRLLAEFASPEAQAANDRLLAEFASPEARAATDQLLAEAAASDALADLVQLDEDQA